MARQQHGIFLSSTNDPEVGKYRTVAREILQEAEFNHKWFAVDMEGFSTTEQPSLDFCKDQVLTCKVYVGIYGPFYGSPNTEQGMSYTQYEYTVAKDAEHKMGFFILPTDHIMRASPVSIIKSQGKYFELQDRFIAEINELHTTRSVSTLDDFKERFKQFLRQLEPDLVSEKEEPQETLSTSSDRNAIRAVTINDLDQKQIAILLDKPQAKLFLDTHNLLNVTRHEHLRHAGFIDARNNILMGAFLCLAPYILVQQHFSACSLHVVTYDGDDKIKANTKFKAEFEDNLINLYQLGMKFFRNQSNLQRVGTVGSSDRDDLEIPERALREALSNALVHRDYESETAKQQPTRIEVYSDRIEIISFGSLIEGISLEELNQSKSFPIPRRRNPIIAKIFLWMEYVELGGTGIGRIYHLLEERELPPPRILESKGDNPTVTIILSRPKTKWRFEENPDELNVATIGAKKANLYTDYDDVDYLVQQGLVGRDELQMQIKETLSGDSARVLLQAFGGTGKTALAAQISADWIEDKGQNILWLEMGASDSETAFEALAHPFGAVRSMAITPTDDKAKMLRQLIKGSNIGLVVLDDVQNGQALSAIQKSIPRTIPLLVTSRQRYPLSVIVTLPDLSEEAAITILNRLAPTLVEDDESAKSLSQELGHHAFAIEIAGRTMQAMNYTARTMLENIKTADVTQLEFPLGYQNTSRKNVAALIETTLNELPDSAKTAFLAWGAFFSTQITPELLGINLNSSNIENDLNILQQYGFATRQNAQQSPEGRPLQVASYRLHDLGFEYVKTHNTDTERNRAVDSCLEYLNRYNEPSLENFSALEPVLDNLLGAAVFAMTQLRYGDVEAFAQGLYLRSQILDYRGYYSITIDLLKRAIKASTEQENVQTKSTYLGNLGAVYSSLGQYQQAIEYNQQALTTSREIMDKQRESLALGNLGIAYRNLGQYQQAIDYYQQALAISDEIGDKRGAGNDLSNLGIAYADLGQYEQAIDYHRQALAISHEIGDKRGEGNRLGNLGSAYASLGQYQQAIDYHTQALAISHEIGDKRGEGNRLGNLGSAYASLGQYQQAIDYHTQALAISHEIGDKRGEGAQLGNLGIAYASLGQYQQAIDYYQQALAIRREIGDISGESNDLNNLGDTYEHLEQYDQAIAYYEMALALYRELGVPHLIERAERNLVNARQQKDSGYVEEE